MKKMQPDFTQRRYTYKALLYAENRKHMHILHTIKRVIPKEYVGIWHTETDEDGKEVLHETGKKHAHIIMHFQNARRYDSLCKKLGFVDDAGQPDSQFLCPVGYRPDGKRVKWETYALGLVYLLHQNAPEKTQYSIKSLWGSPSLIYDASRASDEYALKKMSMAQAVYHVKMWIDEQNRIVYYGDIIDNFVYSPLFKATYSRILYNYIDEHNSRYREKQKQDRLIEKYEREPFRAVSPSEFDIIF